MTVVFLVLLNLLQFVLGEEIKPIREVVQGFGYDVELYTVITSDGYKLMVHRLLSRELTARIAQEGNPRTPPWSEADYGIPVLLVEGILQSSASDLAKGDGVAYSLVDQGYDVWLANYRGNTYARDHVTLSPDEQKFWDFTLHEMGTKDLPAVIDLVLITSKREQLIYVGFSMGTTLFWILASSHPEYQDNITAMVAIGPVARPCNILIFNHVAIRPLVNVILKTMWAMNLNEMFSIEAPFSSTLDWICSEKLITLCKIFFEGFNYIRQQGVKIDSALRVIPYSPAGIGVKVVMHYLQIIESQRFQQFDYGKEGNDYLYLSSKPPVYDLSKITLPVYLVYSERDQIATAEDVEWLAQQLPRRPERKLQDTVNTFRHLDFALNENLNTLLARPLTSLISQLANEHRAALDWVDQRRVVSEYSFGPDSWN